MKLRGKVISVLVAFLMVFAMMPLCTGSASAAEKSAITITLHCSSFESDDLVEPIVLNAESGTTINQAIAAQYGASTNLYTNIFQVDGYVAEMYRTKKPFKEYVLAGPALITYLHGLVLVAFVVDRDG